jgi:hypothetical protein
MCANRTLRVQTEALLLFARAAQAGSADGAYYASVLLLEVGEYAQALNFLMPAVNANHTESLVRFHLSVSHSGRF